MANNNMGETNIMGITPPGRTSGELESKSGVPSDINLEHISFYYTPVSKDLGTPKNWKNAKSLPNLLLSTIIWNALIKKNDSKFFVKSDHPKTTLYFASQSKIQTEDGYAIIEWIKGLFLSARIKILYNVIKNYGSIEKKFKETLKMLNIPVDTYNDYIDNLLKRLDTLLIELRENPKNNQTANPSLYNYMEARSLPLRDLSEFQQVNKQGEDILQTKHKIVVEKPLDVLEVAGTALKNHLGADTAPVEVRGNTMFKDWINGKQFSTHKLKENDALQTEYHISDANLDSDTKTKLQIALVKRLVAAYILDDKDDLGFKCDPVQVGHNVIISGEKIIAYESGEAFSGIKYGESKKRINILFNILSKLVSEQPSGTEERACESCSEEDPVAGKIEAALKGLVRHISLDRQTIIGIIIALADQQEVMCRYIENTNLQLTAAMRKAMTSTVNRRCVALKEMVGRLQYDTEATSGITDQLKKEMTDREGDLNSQYLDRRVKITHFPGRLLGQGDVFKGELKEKPTHAFCYLAHTEKTYDKMMGWGRRYLKSEFKFKRLKNMTRNTGITFDELHTLIINILAAEINNGNNPFEMSRLSNRLLIQTAYTAFEKGKLTSTNPFKPEDTARNQIWDLLHTKSADRNTITNHSGKKINIASNVQPVRDVGKLLKIIHSEDIPDLSDLLQKVKEANDTFGDKTKHCFGTSPIRFFLGPNGYRRLKSAISNIDKGIGSTPKEALENIVCLLADKITHSSADTSNEYEKILGIIENKLVRRSEEQLATP